MFNEEEGFELRMAVVRRFEYGEFVVARRMEKKKEKEIYEATKYCVKTKTIIGSL